MSLRINTNTEAMVGYLNLQKNQGSLASSLQRLSSGLRINRAADDAAGLVISEQMRAQITGMNQAISNSETAVNMVQTAEGALDEMNSLLKKVRSLALHAANAAPNDISQRVADQNELDNAISSISRIAQTTQFGTKKLLDGTLAAANSYDTSKVYKIDIGNALMTRSDFTPGKVTLTIDSSAETNTRTLYVNGSPLTGTSAVGAMTNISYNNTLGTPAAVGGGSFTTASFTEVMGNIGNGNAGFMKCMGGAISNAIGGNGTISVGAALGMGAALGDSSLATFFANTVNGLTSHQIGTSAAGGLSLTVFFDTGPAVSGLISADVHISQAVVTVVNTMRIGVGTETFSFANGETVASIITVLNTNLQGVSFTAAQASAGGLMTTMRTTGAIAAPSITINLRWHAMATGVVVAGTQGGTTSIAATISFEAFDYAGSMNATLGGTVTSFGHNMATTIRLDGTSTITGVTLGTSASDTSAGVFTTADGTAPANTIAGAFGAANNVIKAGASVTLSVAGKDYQFSNGETVADMLSTINGAQSDYTVISDRNSGLVAVRNKLGDGGSVNDLAIRVTDIKGTTSSLSTLANDGVKFEDLGTTAAGIDYGVNVKAHISGTGLPGGTIYLNSNGSDASLLTNAAYGLKLTTNAAYTRAANNTETGVIDTVTSNLTQGATFQVGPNSAQLAAVDIKAVSATQLGLGGDSTGKLRSLSDLSSKQALVNGLSQEALAVIDKAIDDVTVMRGQLGAFQANALESGLSSLRSTQENLSSAESTIRDTDFAKESTSFSRNQILVQSSTSMLAQANQLSQSVLKLLGGG